MKMRMAMIISFIILSTDNVTIGQTALPSDVRRPKPPCAVNYSEWFESGTVKTPNNTTPLGRLCTFYARAAQMFFWLTSPPPPEFGAGPYVFGSPIFHSISPRRDDGRDLFVSSNNGKGFGPLGVAISQNGPQGSPVLFDVAGEMHELAHVKWISPTPSQMVELSQAKIATGGSLVAFDVAHNKISPGKQYKLFDAKLNEIVPIDKFITANGERYQTDATGRAIVYGPGEAENNEVLMTQTGQLVYYEILVNDVYAYFREANYKAGVPAPPFPTRICKIDELSRKFNYVFPDADALVVALKTAWIKVPAGERKRYQKEFLTIDATVPQYRRVSKYLWASTNTVKPATLALVGMHIAFSAEQLPGLIWSTFEHVQNTRNPPYKYTSDTDRVQTQNESRAREWLFSSKIGPLPSRNEPRMHVRNKDIVADTDNGNVKTIGPNNIVRFKPWGSDTDDHGDNTDIIDINASVITQLAPSDVRRNYVLIGAIWDGQGTLKLANSTMETFQPDSNCLGCHSQPTISHIWDRFPRLAR